MGKFDLALLLADPLLCAHFDALGMLHIDLIRLLGKIGDHDNFIARDLRKTAADSSNLLLSRRRKTHLTGRNRHNHRLMACQNALFTIDCRNGQRLAGTVIKYAIQCHNL